MRSFTLNLHVHLSRIEAECVQLLRKTGIVPTEIEANPNDYAAVALPLASNLRHSMCPRSLDIAWHPCVGLPPAPDHSGSLHCSPQSRSALPDVYIGTCW